VYLDVAAGKELVCAPPFNRFNKTLLAASSEISRKWKAVRPAGERGLRGRVKRAVAGA
jgi:hypothetical protein